MREIQQGYYKKVSARRVGVMDGMTQDPADYFPGNGDTFADKLSTMQAIRFKTNIGRCVSDMELKSNERHVSD